MQQKCSTLFERSSSFSMKLNLRQESQKTILGSRSFYISTHGQPSSLISVEPHSAQSYHVAQWEGYFGNWFRFNLRISFHSMNFAKKRTNSKGRNANSMLSVQTKISDVRGRNKLIHLFHRQTNHVILFFQLISVY